MRPRRAGVGVALGGVAAVVVLAACDALTGVGNYTVVSCSDGCGDASGAFDAPAPIDTGASDSTPAPDASDGASPVDAGDAAPDARETDASDASDDASDASDASDGNVPDGASVVVSLGLGQEHTCVVLGDGTLHCWGDNTYGELGTGDTNPQPAPVPVSLPPASAVAADTWHTCAITSGDVRCWGGNANSELGYDGGATCTGGACSLSPGLVLGLPSDAGPATSLGLGSSTFAILGGVSLYTWGETIFPSPISTFTVNAVTSPTIPLAYVDEVSVGTYHACAIYQGKIACWGFNDAGQLGRSNLSDDSPALVAGLTDVAHVCAGPEYTCVLHSTGGSVSCFGLDGSGQLGSVATQTCGSSNIPCSTAPVDVPLPFSSTAIACGDGAACALATDGHVACWGDDSDGALGLPYDGGATSGPTVIPTLSGVAKIAAHGSHACAVLGDGSLWCWGANDSGQVGDGTSGNDVFAPAHVVP